MKLHITTFISASFQFKEQRKQRFSVRGSEDEMKSYLNLIIITGRVQEEKGENVYIGKEKTGTSYTSLRMVLTSIPQECSSRKSKLKAVSDFVLRF